MGQLKEELKDRRDYHGSFESVWTDEFAGSGSQRFEALEIGNIALDAVHDLLSLYSEIHRTSPSSSGISPLMKR